MRKDDLSASELQRFDLSNEELREVHAAVKQGAVNGSRREHEDRHTCRSLVKSPAKLNSRAFTYFRRLARVQHLALTRYSEPLTLQAAADVAGLERTYFCKYFRDKTGITFREWLSWIRILHAVALLSTRNLSLTQLAYAVGFSDQRTFQRAFRKHTGRSPSAVQRILRPNSRRPRSAGVAPPDRARSFLCFGFPDMLDAQFLTQIAQFLT